MTAIAEQGPSPRGMTFEEAARLDPDEQAGEIADGKWVQVTRSTWRHGEAIFKIALLLGAYLQSRPEWRVSLADPGVKLARNPDRLRGPDIAMVRAERVPTGRGVEGWLDGAPDLAVEVVGDSQSISEMTKKALEYLEAGARMVWVVDIDPRRVVLFTPPDRVRILGAEDTLEGGEALPGFRCQVAEMFG